MNQEMNQEREQPKQEQGQEEAVTVIRPLKVASPEQLADVERLERERIYRQLESGANIPPRYRRNQLKACLEHKGWALTYEAMARRMTVEVGNLLVLTGRRGTGKTSMAAELMRLVMCWKWAAYYSVLEDYLRQFWNRSAIDWLAVQERFDDPKLLVLDEVAKISDSPYEQRQFFHIVNKRYNENKHTVLICCVSPAELGEFLGPSLADRVNEGGLVLHCNWESFRK